MVETDEKFVITLNVERWLKFSNNIGLIEQEFYKRFNYQYIESIHPEEEENSGAERAD